MNLLHNNKGNALLLVLLITVIFTALGLSIIASTLGGTKRTEIRKEEIDKAFASIKVIDQITADLSATLQSSENNMAISDLTPANLPDHLNPILRDLEAQYRNPEKGIEQVEFKDVTIDKHYLTKTQADETLTRVYEIEVTAKTGEEKGNISRTATKRLIISPLPSFLKYAVGAEEGPLILNGSPNINGDIFANQLVISKNAKYYSEIYDPNKGPDQEMATPYPSVMKDIYVSDFNSSHLQDILDLLRQRDDKGKTVFYKDKVPALKNDSQYQEINFEEAFKEEQQKALKNVAVRNIYSFAEALPGVTTAAEIPDDDSVPDIQALRKQLVPGIDEKLHHPPNGFILTDQGFECKKDPACFQLHSDLVLTNKNTATSYDDLYINGNLLVVANQDMHFNNIYATGTIEIISNNGEMSMAGHIAAKGDITLTNNKETFETKKAIATEKALTITNKGTMSISNEDTPQKQNLFAVKKIEITNNPEGILTINNDLVAGEGNNDIDAINMELNGESKIEGNLISLKDRNNIKLLVYDNLDQQLETTFKGNVYSSGKLTLRGNTKGEEGQAKENDELKVDGVMYASGEAAISNLNIVGLEDDNADEDPDKEQLKQLILLSGKEGLVITRINEFSNYEEPKEKPDTNYVPADHVKKDKLNIKPITGFFYTEGKAELYGVGSLFYVDGGIFAKEQLEINAVRGEIEKDSDGKPKDIMVERQEDRYSRFIVNYNEDVLLQNFETLPKVKYLSIYSDDLTVE